MKPQYSKQQIIHSFSFASNSAFKKVFEDETTCQKSYEKLQKFVNDASQKVLASKVVQKFIGDDWKTVWGPVVYSHDKNSSFAVADNTMGVYYSPSQKLFVVAIAGTNSISSYGWMKEDFHVNKTAVWKDITGKGKGDISQGTATGLDILINKMKDGNINVLTALKKYISDQNISNAEVAVTGHSLGGALSPALALYLSDKRTEWNNGKNIKMSTYPTAGPTIGVDSAISALLIPVKQASFIEYYDSQIANGNIQYHSVINKLDIVPLAWNKEDLATIPDLYKNDDKDKSIEDVSFGTMALAAVLNTVKKNKHKATLVKQYVYKHIKPTIVNGKFDEAVEKKINLLFNRILKPGSWLANKFIPKSLQSNLENLKNITRFFAQAAYQHTAAYGELLKINEFLGEYSKIVKKLSENDQEQYTEQVVMDMASEAVGFNINDLLDINEEELKALEASN